MVRQGPEDGPKDLTFTRALEVELTTYPVSYYSKISVTHPDVGVWKVNLEGRDVRLTYYGWGSWVLRGPCKTVELVSTDVEVIAGEVYALAI